MDGKVDANAMTAVWEAALEATWRGDDSVLGRLEARLRNPWTRVCRTGPHRAKVSPTTGLEGVRSCIATRRRLAWRQDAR